MGPTLINISSAACHYVIYVSLSRRLFASPVAARAHFAASLISDQTELSYNRMSYVLLALIPMQIPMEDPFVQSVGVQLASYWNWLQPFPAVIKESCVDPIILILYVRSASFHWKL